ncbi:MAG: tyrosine-type recombinase/integrase [Chthoniobacterales bacterium]
MNTKSDDQMLTKSSRGPRFARSDIRYWQRAVFQRVRYRKAREDKSKHFSVQLQFAGRRAEFNLGTANRVVAAGKARDIYEHLKVNGWAATLANFKLGPEPKNDGAIQTVGEFIGAIQATTASRGRTLSEYIRSFRRIVAGAFGIDDPKKYDYRAGGRSGWLDRIDSIPLEKITPQIIQSWKVDFLDRAGRNPAKQRTARISVNSTLRGARSLFSPARLKFISLPSGFISPFASVPLEPRQAMTYRGFFDVRKLVTSAQTELSASDPEAFKAFLLASMAGLRRAEIDRLEWTAFDWHLEKLHIGVTEHFAVKSQGSIGDVDLDRELVEVFKNFYDRRTSCFVLESRVKPRPGSTYPHYRSQRIFKRLTTWLRRHGVDGERPLHALRKEFGSQICDRHGIYAASRALRHSDVGTTALHYLDKRSRATTGLAVLLSTYAEDSNREKPQ